MKRINNLKGPSITAINQTNPIPLTTTLMVVNSGIKK